MHIFSKILLVLIFSTPVMAANSSGLKSCAAIIKKSSTLLNKISRYKATDITKAKKILSAWSKVSILEYKLNQIQGQSQEVFVGLKEAKKPTGVLGKIELLEVSNDYSILAVRDRSNRLHVIDLNTPDLVIYSPTKSTLTDDLNFIDRFSEFPLFDVNTSKLKDIYSSNKNRSKEFKEVLESSVNSQRLQELKSIYEKIGMVASYSAFPVMVFWGGTGISRIFGFGVDSFVLQHSSNFYFGLVGMALMHGGLSAVSIQNRFKILTATALANIGFNIIEEIDFGAGRISNGANTKIGSDLIDFSSGMLSIGVYLSAIAAVEIITKIKSDKTKE